MYLSVPELPFAAALTCLSIPCQKAHHILIEFILPELQRAMPDARVKDQL
jgi:hypothetical protein